MCRPTCIYQALFLICLFIFPAPVCSQQFPGVNPAFIKFTGNWEEVLFQEKTVHNSDLFLRLYLSASPLTGENMYMQASAQLEKFITDLDKPGFRGKSEKTQVQTVQKKLQAQFLKSFNTEVGFDRIFIDGNYNSYTASALTALVFSRLEIPYDIRQEQEAIFLMAFPSTKPQAIRFPDPGMRIFRVDETIRTAFLSFITTQKNMQVQASDASHRDDIFNQYYYGNALIRPENLAGLLYMQASFRESGQGKIHSSLQLSLKSYLLNPSPRQLFYVISLLGNAFRAAKFTEQEDWTLFVIASWFAGYGVEIEGIEAEYGRLTQRMLIENSKLEAYDLLSGFIFKGITDQSVRTGMEYIYQYERGRYFTIKANYPQAANCFREAYLLKPGSVEAQSAFVSSGLTSLSEMNPGERVQKLEDWNKEFPDLPSNGTFMLMQMLSMLEYFTSLYDLSDLPRAEEYRLKFEKLAEENKEVSIPQGAVGEAYTAAALYYFKKSQSKKAKEILQRGLEISPGNVLLLYRLRSI